MPSPASEHGRALVVSGKLRYTPTAPTYYVPDCFTHRVCDSVPTRRSSDLLCDTATVSITVTEVNDPPVAAADNASVAEDSSTGVLVDVRANDKIGRAHV